MLETSEKWLSRVEIYRETKKLLELAENDSETKFEPITENQIHPLICERCGGTIDRDSMRCPYCDTAYKSVGEFPFVHDATADIPEVLYLTFKEYERLISSDEVLAVRRYLDNGGAVTMYRGKRIVIIEDKKIANAIDACNDQIHRLQQQAVDSEDVYLLREIGGTTHRIRDTIESLKKLYKQKQEKFRL